MSNFSQVSTSAERGQDLEADIMQHGRQSMEGLQGVGKSFLRGFLRATTSGSRQGRLTVTFMAMSDQTIKSIRSLTGLKSSIPDIKKQLKQKQELQQQQEHEQQQEQHPLTGSRWK